MGSPCIRVRSATPLPCGTAGSRPTCPHIVRAVSHSTAAMVSRAARAGSPSPGTRSAGKSRVYAGASCTCREKFGPRPIFKIFSLGRVDQEKKEVRKRRASIHRSSPSDAVDYFLVSHVTGWAILGYPALELDTGIFPFVLFLDTVLPRIGPAKKGSQNFI